MKVIKIPMFSKRAVDLKEGICENIYIFIEFSAYCYNGKKSPVPQFWNILGLGNNALQRSVREALFPLHE